MESASIIIIGGGIVGLSIAASLSEDNHGVLVLEKNRTLGQESSSHNSGVIHSGIYYPPATLKATLCRKGNEMIYDICNGQKIPCKKLGKFIVATSENDLRELDRLMNNGRKNGLDDLLMLDGSDVISMEPNVTALRAIFSPSTGIIEPDDLLTYFMSKAVNNGATIVTETTVTRIVQKASGYLVSGRSSGHAFSIMAGTVINSAGLYSDRIAEMAGLDIDSLGYRLHPCKGDYFRLSGAPPVKSLIYPVPSGPGLGIHLTHDMAGSINLGPNAYYSDQADYRVGSDPEAFKEDVRKFLPLVSERGLLVDSSGIRPKLDGPGEGFRDFIIRHEADRGLPGFIDLIGIESPGLTASPAIGEYVSKLYETEIN